MNHQGGNTDMPKKILPLGIENFEKMIQEDYYYVDKTGLITELLKNQSEVTLFTRPRRFGKSLNMSMLKNFFSVRSNKQLFDGLKVTKEKELCEKYMQKFPVILISLKGMEALTYEGAFEMAVQVMNQAAAEVDYLKDSENLTKEDKETFKKLLSSDMKETEFMGSLRKLSYLLTKHHKRKTVILIDEYDVPLAKAFTHGYYDQMVNLIRGFLGNALKTNDYLQFAVLSGCMRISKESIFTGLNNFNIMSITDVEFDEYFGFTDEEVKKLLKDYDLSEYYESIKDWYDGYHFGNVDVYCPWDVICHCRKLLADPKIKPQNYWMNTSSNEIVKKIIEKTDHLTTKREIERLVAGDEITKELHQELTYEEMYTSIDNIWSVLFTTGYLTQRGRADGNMFHLVIPNMEIRNIYTSQIMSWLKENVAKDGETLGLLCDALQQGNAPKVEEYFTAYLKKTISIRDTFARKNLKENFFHGILLGILRMKEQWAVFSNRETGDGYSDIMVETEDSTGIIIEVKYAHDGDLDAGCKEALQQIEDTRYEEELLDEGMERILKYGIACYKKRCKVSLYQQEESANEVSNDGQ